MFCPYLFQNKIREVNKKMTCNIVIDQQASLPVSDDVASEAKLNDPKRQRRGRKSLKMYIKKLNERLLKNNQKTQMTLKEFIDYFQQDMNDPGSTLIAIEETMRFVKEEHNTEINISIVIII